MMTKCSRLILYAHGSQTSIIVLVSEAIFQTHFEFQNHPIVSVSRSQTSITILIISNLEFVLEMWGFNNIGIS